MATGGYSALGSATRLTCDSVIGAVLVSVASSEVFCIGLVPKQYQPAGAARPDNESGLMWALKGAGTNFGILVSITFKACAAPTYLVRNSTSPLNDASEALRKINEFDELIAKEVPRNCSVDAYLFCDEDKLHLGVTTFESSTNGFASKEQDAAIIATRTHVNANLSPGATALKNVDSLGLFETDVHVRDAWWKFRHQNL